MSRGLVIGVAGATGLVGNEMVTILGERKFPAAEVRLFASEESVGEVYKIGELEAEVELLEDDSFRGVDIALFATSSELSARFVPLAAESGTVAIDNSSHFRMDPTVPLIVPEVNGDAIPSGARIIANPNCSTIQLVPVLQAIHKAAGLKRVVVSTYQSVSGAGKAALDELWAQTLAICNQRAVENEVFPHQIAFNCLPQIDVFLENGYTKEEMKIIQETRKILALPGLPITSTAVRVPVFYGHAESVNVETERSLSPSACAALLEKVPGLMVCPVSDEYPMQLDVAGNDEIRVGRIRADESVPHGLQLWVVADNVRKGAALNAVQIAELLLPSFKNRA